MVQGNWHVKEDIREYWSSRAATFDDSVGHEIFSDEERAAWHRLIAKHLGDGNGGKALDLASGTGVISRLLCDSGYSVTGLDFAEAMIARAESKAKMRGLDATYILGDAEDTRLGDNAYDVIMTRHLVWTLPNPAAAFADWWRVLKPGGRVLIIDADMTPRTLKSRILRRIAGWLKGIGPVATSSGGNREVHERIVSQVHFAEGARAEAVAELLRTAGFQDVVIDRNHGEIRRAQGLFMPLKQRVERASQDRYAIRASKPAAY